MRKLNSFPHSQLSTSKVIEGTAYPIFAKDFCAAVALKLCPVFHFSSHAAPADWLAHGQLWCRGCRLGRTRLGGCRRFVGFFSTGVAAGEDPMHLVRCRSFGWLMLKSTSTPGTWTHTHCAPLVLALVPRSLRRSQPWRRPTTRWRGGPSSCPHHGRRPPHPHLLR